MQTWKAMTPLPVNLAWNMAVYTGARLLTRSRAHLNMTTPLDDCIPLIPWTVSIYLGCFLFWGLCYWNACRLEAGLRWRFFSAEFLSKGLCLICFLVLPATNLRPVPTGPGAALLRLLYRIDAPDNLFPSIHCLVSWFCWIAARENPNASRRARALTLPAALAVCVSTLTTKQHVLADCAAGIALAELCWRITEPSGFLRLYRRVLQYPLRRFP